MTPYDHPLETFEREMVNDPQPLAWWKRHVWALVIGSGLVFYALLVGAWWMWRGW